MPWLNSGLTDLMLRASALRGFDVSNTWWRDESALETWWRNAGFSLQPKQLICPVPCGVGFVAWIRIVHEGPDVGLVWAVIAFAPDEGKPCGPDKALFGDAKKLPASYVTQWSARDDLKMPHNKATPGDNVACCDYTGFGRIAKCVSVDSRGAVTQVSSCDGEVIAAASIAKRWFKLEERDQAFDVFWREGKTTWQSYKAMASALWHMQTKLAKQGIGEAPPKHAARAPNKWQSGIPEALAAPLGTVASRLAMDVDTRTLEQRGSEAGARAYGLQVALEWIDGDYRPEEYKTAWRAAWRAAMEADLIGYPD